MTEKKSDLYYHGTGRRKSAVARVRLLSGKWVSQALQTLGKKKEEAKGTEK